jgi:hypothetical protein
MIDWGETLQYYGKLIHANLYTKELCEYYQNQFRFYFDEVESE